MDFVLDLHGELARRREHQHAALAGRAAGRLRAGRGTSARGREQPLQGRHDERRGLAGAGLGARNQIVAGERERNDGALNRPRLGEPEIANAFEQPRVEVEGRKRHRRGVARRRLERMCARESVGRLAYPFGRRGLPGRLARRRGARAPASWGGYRLCWNSNCVSG